MFLPQAYYDGAIQAIEDIHISPLDLGVQRGYSVFDFLKIIDHKNPWLDDYLNRLYRSAQEVNIQISEKRSAWPSIIEDLLSANQADSAYIKVIVSAGSTDNGYNPISKSKTLLLCSEVNVLPAHIYESGAKLTLREYSRDIPHIKTTNYLFSASQAIDIEDTDVVDILYHSDDLITECSRCNFFIVTDTAICTPAQSILEGITRKRVLAYSGCSLPYQKSEVSIADFMAQQIPISLFGPY